jgi:hypothetical protein
MGGTYPPGEDMATVAYHRRVGYIVAMSHTVKEKKRLLARVRRIKGQVEASPV